MIGFLIGAVIYAALAFIVMKEWTKTRKNTPSRKAKMTVCILWFVIVIKWVGEGIKEVFSNK